MAQLPREVVQTSSLEMFQSHRDVALKNMVSGLMVGLEVFSNLNDSEIASKSIKYRGFFLTMQPTWFYNDLW